MSADALLRQAMAMKDTLMAVRRDIHRHPELAFQEQRTAEKGRDWLQGLGLEVQEGIAGTYGLVATLDTGRPRGATAPHSGCGGRGRASLSGPAIPGEP